MSARKPIVINCEMCTTPYDSRDDELVRYEGYVICTGCRDNTDVRTALSQRRLQEDEEIRLAHAT